VTIFETFYIAPTHIGKKIEEGFGANPLLARE
jgi:hypothetical protein